MRVTRHCTHIHLVTGLIWIDTRIITRYNLLILSQLTEGIIHHWDYFSGLKGIFRGNRYLQVAVSCMSTVRSVIQIVEHQGAKAVYCASENEVSSFSLSLQPRLQSQNWTVQPPEDAPTNQP